MASVIQLSQQRENELIQALKETSDLMRRVTSIKKPQRSMWGRQQKEPCRALRNPDKAEPESLSSRLPSESDGVTPVYRVKPYHTAADRNNELIVFT